MFYLQRKINRSWVWTIKTPYLEVVQRAYSRYRAQGVEVRIREVLK